MRVSWVIWGVLVGLHLSCSSREVVYLPRCDNLCTLEGATECVEGQLRTCEADEDGWCLVWGAPAPCGVGFCMDGARCRDPADFQTSAFYPDLNGGMLAVRGNELSNWHDTGSFFTNLGYACVHSPASSADCSLPIRPSDIPDEIPSGQDFWYPFAHAHDISLHDGVGMLYHPGQYNHTLEWYLALFDYRRDSMVGMEIFNSGDRYNLATPSEASRPRGRWYDHRALWDYMNANRDYFDLVWGFSNSDYHGDALGDTVGLRNANRHYMKSLTEDALRENLRSGAFTASYYPSSRGIGNAPVLTGVAITATRITLSCEGCTQIRWYGNKSLGSGMYENTRHPDHDENVSEPQFFLMFTTDPYPDETTLTIDLDAYYEGSAKNFVRAVLINSSGRTYVQPFGFIQDTLSGGGRVYRVANPYADVDFETVEIFKSNLHTHTGLSDGWATVPNVITYYADAGYRILAITDHDTFEPRAKGRPYAGRQGTGPDGDEPMCHTTWPWNEWFEHHADTSLWDGSWLYTGAIPEPSIINWWQD